jgi:SAM-dependent methyltransferase
MKAPGAAEPVEIGGIQCYAPELAHSEQDYPAEAYARLVELEANNFWFRSRNRIISSIFRKYLPTPQPARVLEIGCGTGFVLSTLHAEKRFDLVGAEQLLSGLIFARQRLPELQFVQLDARRLPYRSEFHGVGAFDVLEHIDEDEEVMASVHSALLPGGLFVVTVPQHAWLWSAADEHAHHKRRYTRGQLTAKLQRAGFKMLFCSSFVFTLLPLMYASRLLRKSGSAQGQAAQDRYDELALPRIVDAVFAAAMRIDEWFIAAGVSLPAGGSLLAVAQKKN